jgi:hypothetical protein
MEWTMTKLKWENTIKNKNNHKKKYLYILYKFNIFNNKSSILNKKWIIIKNKKYNLHLKVKKRNFVIKNNLLHN